MQHLDHSRKPGNSKTMSKTTTQGETLKDIAAMRGVSYEAIVHTRDRRKIKPVGNRGRAALYDPAAFESKEQAESDSERSDFRRRYERARAEKLEIQNAKARGELIDRALVARTFSEIYSIERSIILNVGPAHAGTIAALSGEAAEKTLKIQKLIDGEMYAALGAIKAAINNFLKRIEADERIKDEIPENKPRKKAAKKEKKPAG
jgi:hypothetical protein